MISLSFTLNDKTISVHCLSIIITVFATTEMNAFEVLIENMILAIEGVRSYRSLPTLVNGKTL